jgi:hypothetical protein
MYEIGKSQTPTPSDRDSFLLGRCLVGFFGECQSRPPKIAMLQLNLRDEHHTFSLPTRSSFLRMLSIVSVVGQHRVLCLAL